MQRLSKLKKRSDFVRVSVAKKSLSTSYLIVQYYKHSRDECLRVGFTVSRKVGKAVIRNKVKRRLKELVNQIYPLFLLKGFDIVFIAKSSAVYAPFKDLKEDVIKAFKGVIQQEDLLCSPD